MAIDHMNRRSRSSKMISAFLTVKECANIVIHLVICELNQEAIHFLRKEANMMYIYLIITLLYSIMALFALITVNCSGHKVHLLVYLAVSQFIYCFYYMFTTVTLRAMFGN